MFQELPWPRKARWTALNRKEIGLTSKYVNNKNQTPNPAKILVICYYKAESRDCVSL